MISDLDKLRFEERMGKGTDEHIKSFCDSKFISSNHVHGLIDLAEDIQLENKTVVEIGSYLGVSTEVFAQFNPKKIYAVDMWGMNPVYVDCNYHLEHAQMSWRDVEQVFDRRIEKYPFIEKIKNFASAFCAEVSDGDIDVVYIDGEHTPSGVDQDIRQWLPKVKSGGYICGHDYYDRQAYNEDEYMFELQFPVKKCVQYYFGDNIKRYSDSSWSHKKA